MKCILTNRFRHTGSLSLFTFFFFLFRVVSIVIVFVKILSGDSDRRKQCLLLFTYQNRLFCCKSALFLMKVQPSGYMKNKIKVRLKGITVRR